MDGSERGGGETSTGEVRFIGANGRIEKERRRGGGRTCPPRFGFMCDISFFMLLARYSGSFAESAGPDPSSCRLSVPSTLLYYRGVWTNPPLQKWVNPNIISSEPDPSHTPIHTAEPLHSELTFWSQLRKTDHPFAAEAALALREPAEYRIF